MIMSTPPPPPQGSQYIHICILYMYIYVYIYWRTRSKTKTPPGVGGAMGKNKKNIFTTSFFYVSTKKWMRARVSLNKTKKKKTLRGS